MNNRTKIAEYRGTHRTVEVFRTREDPTHWVYWVGILGCAEADLIRVKVKTIALVYAEDWANGLEGPWSEGFTYAE